jgi:hypothetical protein
MSKFMQNTSQNWEKLKSQKSKRRERGRRDEMLIEEGNQSLSLPRKSLNEFKDNLEIVE